MDLREKIARIIAPEAWKWHDRGLYQDRYTPDREISLRKADDIIALKDPT